MTSNRNIELAGEATERPLPSRHLENLDDISREIADRRVTEEFADIIPPGRLEVLCDHPDKIESPEEFNQAATAAGIQETDGVLGWSTNLESPAHVLKGEVPEEIATLVHEDLHRLTAPETLAEMTANPDLRELYEGITEFLAEKAVSDLHEHQSGQCYPEQVELAGELAAEVGEPAVEKFFFTHELTAEVEAAINRLTGGEHSA